MLLVGAKDLLNPPDEHPGVPEMAARSDHPLRRVPLRLLDEALDGAHLDRPVDVELVTCLDVAETSVGSLRRNPECHELAAFGRRGRGDQDLAELAAIGDAVVRRATGYD